MLKNPPTSIDVLDFQFKLHCRLKVFDNEDSAVFSNPCNLLATASRYGLIFVGTQSGNFQVVLLETFDKLTSKDKDFNNYPRRTISIPSNPKHLNVNCDSTKLAVVIEKDSCASALIYDVQSFLKQEIKLLQEIKLSTNVQVIETCWNPTIPSIFTVCKNDGSLGLFDIKDNGIEVHSLPPEAGATCMCWSPKGKQIAVGSKNGVITQYKPDLKAAKIIQGPPLEGSQYPIALQWISNYQFIAVYHRKGDDPQSNLIVIDAPRTGDSSYINYEDICFSYGSTRPPQFYLTLLPTWNVLMAASSNSMEVGVLGANKDVWTQWILGDAARAELPLSSSKQDTLPIGLAIDTGSTQKMLWGESQLPPTPYLLLLSHHGVLCCFNIVNLKKEIPSVCQAPDSLQDKSGINQFITVTNVETSTKKSETLKVTESKPTILNVPAFGDTKNVITMKQPTPPTSSLFGTNVLPTTNISSGQPLFGNNAPQSLFGAKPLATPQPSQDNINNAKPTPLFGGTRLLFAPKFQTAPPIIQPQLTLPSSQSISTNPAGNLFGSKPELTITSRSAGEITTSGATVAMTHVTSNKSNTSAQQVNINQPQNNSPAQTNVGGNTQQPKVSATQQHKPTSAGDKTQKVTDSDKNIVLEQKIREDCINFEADLKTLLHKVGSLNINLGTDAELTEMVQSTNLLQEFLHEINEATNTQSAEIHTLKQGLMQAWAWYEDARSRFAIFKDPTLLTILKAQPLDPVSERKLADIEYLLRYIHTQLVQANDKLDEQWNDFQDSCKSEITLKLPVMESMYQTMVCQNATLQKQMYILKEIQNRRNSLKRIQPSLSLLISVENADFLEDEMKKLQIDTFDLIEIQYEKVLERQKKLTKKKEDKLKELLKKHEVSHVSVVKPQLANMSMEVSTLFGPPISPIGERKKFVPVKLDFLQSTPLPKSATKTVIENASIKSDFTPLTIIKKTEPITVKQYNINQPNLFSKSEIVSSTTMSAVTTNYGFKPFSKTATIAQDLTIPASTTAKSLNLFQTVSSAPSTLNLNIPKTTATAFVSAFAPTTQTNTLFGATKSATLPAVTSATNSLTSGTSNLFSNIQTSSLSNMAATNNNAFKVTPTTKPANFENPGVKSPTIATTSTSFSFSLPTTNQALSSEAAKSTITITSSSDAKSFTFNLDKIGEEKATLNITGSTGGSTLASTTPSIFGNQSGKAVIFGQNAASISPVVAAPKTNSNITSLNNLTVTTVKPQSTAASNLFGAVASTSTLFGSQTSLSTSKSNIGGDSSNGAISQTSLFGSTSSSLQIPSTTSVNTKSSEASFLPNVTSNNSAATTTTSSLTFGNALGKSTAMTSVQSSTTSILSASLASTNSTATTGFSFKVAASNTGTLFGNTTSVPASSAATTSSFAGFGTPTTVSTTKAASSAFGAIATTTTASEFVNVGTAGFGAADTQFSTPSTNTSIFGNAKPITTTPSAFVTPSTGSPFATSAVSTSTFGTTTASTFGQPASFGSSIFASPPTSNSVFGTTTTTSSIFGASPVFGANTTSAPLTTSTKTNSGFGFGSGASIFSNTTQPGFGTTATSPFNTVTTTATTAFGSPFVSTSPFSTATTTATPSSSFGSFSFAAAAAKSPGFGESSTGTFGFGNLTTGTPVTSTTTGFGSPSAFGSQPQNPFGRSTSSGQEQVSFAGSLFGQPITQSTQSSTSIFGSPTPTTTTTSLFGSATNSPFGAKPAFGSSTFGSSGGAFGQSPSFGQNTSFVSSSFGNNQTTGPFSGGTQSAFGSAAFSSPAAGFGAPPAFGASSGGFGSSPAFGSAPAFGNAPVFGSPGKVFGGGVADSFASTGQQQNSTFASLATQNTLGFGSLAQQSPTAPSNPSAFSGGSSFSTWR